MKSDNLIYTDQDDGVRRYEVEYYHNRPAILTIEYDELSDRNQDILFDLLRYNVYSLYKKTVQYEGSTKWITLILRMNEIFELKCEGLSESSIPWPF
jgi:hypothetical protein